MKTKIISILVSMLMIPLLGTMVTANAQPTAPIIDGPTQCDANVVYQFTFCAINPNGMPLKYYVEWDDSQTTGWTICYNSGETITLEHMYTYAGTFTITARAQECPNGPIGPDGTHVITVPRARHNFNIEYLNFLHNFLEYHPNLFPILRYILGL